MVTSAPGASARVSKFVSASSNDYWTSVGIFEEALKAKADVEQLMAETRKQLMLLGPANLRLLCEESGVPREEKATAAEMVNLLVAEADENTLIHIREFLRRRTEAVEEVFDVTFTERQRTAMEAALSDLADGIKVEKIKPLTKLFLVYRKDPDRLLEAFYLQLWRSKPTYLEYQSETKLPNNTSYKLESNATSLVKTIKASLSKTDVRLLGIHTNSDGNIVVVMHREFSPVIKRDFRQEYNVHFACGLIVFGVSADRERVLVKAGNINICDALKFFFEREFKVKLRSLRHEVFSDYDPKKLEVAFLGGYKEDSGIEISDADFRHSGLSSRCPLSIRSYGSISSIRADLKELVETKSLQLRSLDDIASLKVLFGGKSATINIEQSPGGAIFLKFNDSGWSDELRRNFEQAFLTTFFVPVNKYIDPQRMEMGGLRVIASLLAVTDEEDVHTFQQEQYEALIEAGILVREPKAARVCRSVICKPRKPVLDDKIQVCPKCDRPIEDWVINGIRRDNGVIAKYVSDVLLQSIGWVFGKPKKFEGVEYHPLHPKDHPESGDICVLIRDRLITETKVKFQRSSQALAVIEPHTDDRHIYPDNDGIGRISLAYLIISRLSPFEKDACTKRCRALVKSLLIHHQERVATAARLSYQHLQTGTAGDKGNVYETEIFNVLRSVFPYCYQIGREGSVEPDGFVCIPVYEDNAMEGVETWNWSYDAKHSDKTAGYDLDIDERRKIVNYIDKFRARVGFSDRSCKLRAHVIISNKLAEPKMKAAADFVFGSEGGVKLKNRDVRLVLMLEEFVIRLYELVAEKREDYQRRRPRFGKLFFERLSRNAPNGYTVMAKDDAEQLFQELLKGRPLEKAMTEGELISGLD